MRVIGSSYVGLFWLKEDYSDFDMFHGDVEFHLSDLVGGVDVLPGGTHRSYGVGSPYSLPRGRVEVSGGKVIISVGCSCPHDIIDRIIDAYGLERFRSIIEVKRNKFWDRRL